MENRIDWTKEPDQVELRRAYDLRATDSTQALVALKALADRGSMMSMMYIAEIYRNGKETSVDLDEAQKWLRRAIQNGSVPASYELGRMLFEFKNYPQSKEAFEIGETHNFAPSINMLGTMYLNGIGVEKNLTRARELLERASSLGHVFAKRNLAGLLVRGADGPHGFFRGVRLFLVAIKDTLVVVCSSPFSDRLR